MSDKLSAEAMGSVSQRMLRYDGAAAAESTHQSRADYVRRKEGALARPAWMRHAASHVVDIDEAKAAAGIIPAGALADKKKSHQQAREILLRKKPEPTLSQRILSEQRCTPARSPKRNPPLSADDVLHPTSPLTEDQLHPAGGVEEKVLVWSHNGKAKLPASKVPGHVSPSSRRSATPTEVSVASNYSIRSSVDTANEFGIGIKKKPPFEGTQPVPVGELLGKNLNITRAQRLQRARYEFLERQRLDEMQHTMEDKGWNPVVKPGAKNKVVGRRIYCGLPKELDQQSQQIYEEMKQQRKRSPLSKRDLTDAM